MKRILLTGATALILAAPMQTLAADGPSWDYLSLAWVATGKLKESGFSENIKGYRLDAVKSLGEVAFIRASVNAYDIDEGMDLDVSPMQIGVGARYRVPAGPMPVDVWGSLNYERLNLGPEVMTGPGVDLGVRAQVMPALDIGLTAKVYSDLDTQGADIKYTGYELSGAYAVHPQASILLTWSDHELKIESDKLKFENVVSLGVRFNY
jgi:hypothetical protein